MTLDARFDRIALCLSGGGYRAAAFHLGGLTLLDRAGLIANVRALSTVSGGTITGAAWAESLARGQTFSAFYARLFSFLRDVDVIDSALERMRDSGKLITAAADVYATLFDSTLGDIQRGAAQLDEISFNATDMTHGLAFRFVKSANPRVHSGNAESIVDHEVGAGLRIADIVAASSCFPGAFEPIVYPADFRGSASDDATVLTPLMDGGIFDNQGVDSLLLVRARHRDDIDRIIVSDADTNAPPMYEEPQHRHGGFVRVWMVALLAAVLEGAALASIGLLLRHWRDNIVPLFVCAATAVLVGVLVVTTVRLKQSQIANRPRPLLWRHIMRLTVAELIDAVNVRAVSLMALTARVFMKRVRMLTYRRLYERPSTSSRTITNLISDIHGAEDVSEPVRALVHRAAGMPTTLWFDNENQMREVIAAGAITMCHNLLRHLSKVQGRLPQRAETLREVCGRIWSEFERDPMSAAPAPAAPLARPGGASAATGTGE